jgi:hypothetical protein
MPVPADHRGAGGQDVEHALLDALNDGREKRIHLPPRHELDARQHGTNSMLDSVPGCCLVSSELSSAPALVAEKARKRSPEKWLPVVPVRAMPSGTRLASALHWPGSSGASVPMIVMHEPAPGGASQSVSSIGLSSLSIWPT